MAKIVPCLKFEKFAKHGFTPSVPRSFKEYHDTMESMPSFGVLIALNR